MIKKMPELAYGSSRVIEQENMDILIQSALDSGYKHFDTAQNYFNEELLGEALKKSGVAREEYWITTKISIVNLKYHTYESIKHSLKKLQTKYVDAILLHGMSTEEINLRAFKELLRAKVEGLVRHIGVSNFNISQIERIKEETGVYPEYNQIICSVKARLNQLEKFCKDKGIVLMGYSSLKPFYNNLPNPLFTFDSKQREFIEELSKKYNTSPAMILLAYSKQNGYIILARSSSPQRTKDNFKILEFEISQDDLKKLDKMNTYNDENFEEENKPFLAKEMFEESVYKVGARISEESDNKYREYVYKKLWKKGII
ncbi:aldo/keto reductase [Mycoplasma marinum]|uniref:aldo/keto reductase family protein n=1 Tax=Mycoplasma marinum TaxID=1937190 RepID=UPI003B3879D5